MNEQLFSKIQKDTLYKIAGKSYALYLGYPDFQKFLQKASYFLADLDNDTIEEYHFSDTMSKLFPADMPSCYEEFIGIILTPWTPQTQDKDIREFFDKDNLLMLFSAGESFISEDYTSTIDGKMQRKQVNCQLYKDESGRSLALFLSCDVTNIYDDSVKLLRRVEYDGLTGLYNRTAGDLKIIDYFRQYPQDSAAVVIIDLDFFKRFNDQFGHDVGDNVLRSAARNLEKYFGRDSIIVRNGGDEFLVLLKNRSASECDDEIHRFSLAAHTIDINGTTYRYTFSIGYALYPEQGREYHDLTMKADLAMYTIKMKHRNSCIKYHPHMLMQKRTQLSFNMADIVSGIPGAILVYKADEREEILFANDQLFELFECSSMEELLQFSGDSFKNIVHPDDLDRVEASIMRQVSDNSEGLDYVSYRIITKTGKIKYIDDIGHLVKTPKYGDIFYVFLYDKEQKNDILRKAGEIPAD